MPVHRKLLLLYLAGLLGTAGCDRVSSKMNSVSPCDTMEPRILSVLLQYEMGRELQNLDRDRLLRVAQVSDLKEVSSGYNKRVCSGTVHILSTGDRADVVVLVEQAEGVKNWVELTITEASSPNVNAIAQQLRSSYSAGDA